MCSRRHGLWKVTQDTHLFPNPVETERFKEWVLSIGGDILGLNNEYIFKQSCVCHAQFEEKYCCRNNRISNIAVPTINLPKSISLPIFTLSERRPLRQLEYSSKPVPSASSVCAAGLTTTFFEADFTEKENIECRTPSLAVTQKIKKTIATTHTEKKLYLKLVQLQLININCVNFFVVKRVLLSLSVSPAFENTRSHGTDVAVIFSLFSMCE
ncbi:unnamed protein product [Parnassius apollo]|uniref:(apollo) hypothetical protein n=1 Tax=Parnassius apollo TaxID=110799 RepID=A0A8S3W3S0_PARAO|nr:unnamed protein product [Parnassius apollo]